MPNVRAILESKYGYSSEVVDRYLAPTRCLHYPDLSMEEDQLRWAEEVSQRLGTTVESLLDESRYPEGGLHNVSLLLAHTLLQAAPAGATLTVEVKGIPEVSLFDPVESIKVNLVEGTQDSGEVASQLDWNSISCENIRDWLADCL